MAGGAQAKMSTWFSKPNQRNAALFSAARDLQCGIREDAKCLDGIRDLTSFAFSESGICQNLGTGCGIGKENGIRDRDNRSSR